MNATNYDKLFTQYVESTEKGKLPKLLLHVCCAPCSTYCLTRLLPYFDITMYYSNDNITVTGEWLKRYAEVQKLVGIVNRGEFEVSAAADLKLVSKPLNESNFFQASKGLEQEKEGGLRCKECFTLRLSDAVSYAKANGFDCVTTTLTVSPYKNSQLLNEIGLSLAADCDSLKWLPSDFKKHNGYSESIRLSQKYNLYRQHFCGCSFSLAEMQNKT